MVTEVEAGVFVSVVDTFSASVVFLVTLCEVVDLGCVDSVVDSVATGNGYIFNSDGIHYNDSLTQTVIIIMDTIIIDEKF